MDSSILVVWKAPFPIGGIRLFLLSPCFIEIPVFNANSVDPDQTPRSAASDLGLHCLSTALLWDAGHKWVNPSIVPVIFNCSKPYKLTFHIIMMK